MTKTFEKWLENYFLAIESQTTKDEFEDAFDRWLSELEASDVMQYAEIYGRECYLDGKEEIVNKLKEDGKL